MTWEYPRPSLSSTTPSEPVTTPLDDGDESQAATARAQLVAMLNVLGLNPEAPEWATDSPSHDSDGALTNLVSALLDARARARETKDFGLADQIRDVLQQGGIEVTDTADGPQWSVRGS